jgi:hypothetical protein
MRTSDSARSCPWAAVYVIALAVAVGSSTGCDNSEFPLAPVSGIVTLDGRPLPDAHVGFEPTPKPGTNVAGPGSYATTDADGRFQLLSLDKRPGAVTGVNRVSIRTFKAERGPDGEMKVLSQEVLPNRYTSGSELTFEVPENGTDQANFELSLK